MGSTTQVTEITQDLDRLNGIRRLVWTSPSGDELAVIEVQWKSNVSLPDEQPLFEPVNHPPGNQALQEVILDLLCALRANPYSLDLTQQKEQAS